MSCNHHRIPAESSNTCGKTQLSSGTPLTMAKWHCLLKSRKEVGLHWRVGWMRFSRFETRSAKTCQSARTGLYLSARYPASRNPRRTPTQYTELEWAAKCSREHTRFHWKVNGIIAEQFLWCVIEWRWSTSRPRQSREIICVGEGGVLCPWRQRRRRQDHSKRLLHAA